jgi:hypothetical protein
VSDSAYRKSFNLDSARRMGICPLNVLCRWTRCSTEAKAKMIDLGHRHGLPMPGYHLGKVLRKRINLLLEEEKGGTDGTQLPFVNDKGEFLHGVVSASKLIPSSYDYVRRKQGKQSKGRD